MLPFVQCPRDDYCLRAETVSLLRGVGIEDELLTFGGNAYDDALCDNDLRRLHAEQRLKITLVDHNAMTPRQVRDSPFFSPPIKLPDFFSVSLPIKLPDSFSASLS